MSDIVKKLRDSQKELVECLEGLKVKVAGIKEVPDFFYTMTDAAIKASQRALEIADEIEKDPSSESKWPAGYLDEIVTRSDELIEAAQLLADGYIAESTSTLMN